MMISSVVDGKHVVYNPFDGAEGSEYSKDIVMINGYTKDDACLYSLLDQAMLDYKRADSVDAIAKYGYEGKFACCPRLPVLL